MKLLVAIVLSIGFLGSTTLHAQTAESSRAPDNNEYTNKRLLDTQPLSSPPPAPEADHESGRNEQGFQANWQPSDGAEGYYLDVGKDRQFLKYAAPYESYDVGNVTSYFADGLDPKDNYWYRLRAYNDFGTSDYSNVIHVRTLYEIIVEAPVALEETEVSANGFKANWEEANDADGYLLDVSENNTFTTFVENYESYDVGKVTSFYVSASLNPENTYWYRLRAYNLAGESPYSNSIDITLASSGLDPPVADDASSTGQFEFTANWQTVSGATDYLLDVATDPGFDNFVYGYQDYFTGNVTSTAVSGLNPNSTYYYRLRASNGVAASDFSNTVTVTTLPYEPGTPYAMDASNVGTNSFQANWATQEDADGFKLFVYADSQYGNPLPGYDGLDVGAASSHTVNNGIQPNTTYWYRLTAYNEGGESIPSNAIEVTTNPESPSDPPDVNNPSNVSQTSFTASWSVVPGATGYYLDVSTDPAFGSFLPGYNGYDAGNTTQHTVTSLTPGTTYYYRVRAYNSGGESSNSATEQVTTLAETPDPPLAEEATNITAESFRANWSDSQNADGYYLYVSENSTFTSYVGQYDEYDVGQSTHGTITGLDADTRYWYKLKAYNESGESDYSNVIEVQTLLAPPGPPTALEADNYSASGFRANWEAVNIAAGYIIELAGSLDFSRMTNESQTIDAGDFTSYEFTSLDPNTRYYYRVKAYNDGSESAWSHTISPVTLPAPPQSQAASIVGPFSFTANWAPPAIEGTEDYTFILQVSDQNDFSTLIAEFTGLASSASDKTIDELFANTTYWYRLFAVNEKGSSAASAVQQVTTLQPVIQATPAQLDFGEEYVNGRSEKQFITVSGENLGDDVVITAPEHFQILEGDNTFLSTLTLTPVDGVLEPREVGIVFLPSETGEITADVTITTRAAEQAAVEVSGASIPPEAPEVVTTEPTNVTTTGFVSGGRVVDSNGSPSSNEGVVWNTTGSPTTSSSKKESGDLIGSWSLPVQSLTPNTLYYVRAFATNDAGTGYGNEYQQATLPPAPVTVNLISLSPTTAELSWATPPGMGNEPHTFEVELASDAAFSSIVASEQGVNALIRTHQFTNLPPGGAYYARVRISNSAGEGEWQAAGAPATTGQPSLLVDDSQLFDFGQIYVDNTSAVQTVLVSGEDLLGEVNAAFPDGFLGSLDGENFQSSLSLLPVAEVLEQTEVFVLFNPQSVGEFSGDLLFTGEGLDDVDVQLSGTGIEQALPSVQVSPAAAASVNSIDVSGILNDNGGSAITEFGFLLSESNPPTMDDTKLIIESLGEGGTFFGLFNGLEPGTEYFVAAFATNGQGTGISNALSVTTIPAAPQTAAENITANSFDLLITPPAGAVLITGHLKTSADSDEALHPFQLPAVPGIPVTRNFEGLPADTEFWWEVTVSNVSGVSEAATGNTRTRLMKTQLMLPLHEAEGVARNPMMQWGEVPGATGYELRVATNSELTEGLETYTPDGNEMQFTGENPLKPDHAGPIYWAVRAVKNDEGVTNTGEWSDIWSFTRQMRPPIAAPAQQSPQNGAEMESREVPFAWEPVDNAEWYRIELGLDPGFEVSEVFDNVPFVSGMEELPDGATYWWKVTAANAGGYGPESDAWSFTINLFPPVELTAVPNADGSVDLQWLDSSINETGFTIYRAAGDGDFVEVGTTATDETGFNDTGLDPETLYRYKVVAFNDNFISVESNIAEIETPTSVSVVAAGVPEEYALLQNYPNPFNPSTTISYGLPFESDVTVTVYTLNGEIVEELVAEVQSPGYYAAQWNAGSLASGVYLFTIRAASTTSTETFTSVKKMLLVK